MAKKITKPTVGSTTVKSGSSSPIFDMLENISKTTSIQLDNEDKEQTYISTGIYIFNALLSKSILNGGLSKNAITILAGDPQTGKSFILYNVARNAQKEGYFVVFIDTEQSVDRTKLKDFGLETGSDKLALMRTNNVEDIKIGLTKLITNLKEKKLKGEDIPKTIILLDSIGQLASAKEIEDANDGKTKTDMSRAKAIKSLFRIINSDLGYLEIPLLATNHIYMCLTAGHEVVKSDGSFEKIENLKSGDIVKTLNGDKHVIDTTSFNDCPIMELTLDNGDIIKCTPQHRFLVNEKWSSNEEDSCWIKAEDLKKDDIILSIKHICD